MKEREIVTRYRNGEMIPARDFNNGGLDVFSNIYPEILKEHVTRQLDFEGEVWYKKVRNHEGK